MGKCESNGTKDLHFDIRVEPSNQARAMKIMEAVSSALKSRSFQIRVEEDRKTSAEKDGVAVQFHIEELYKQITKTESWGSDSARTYTHIVGREPLGRLALMLDDWAGQFRRSFKDGKRQRVENIIEEFAETVEQVVTFRKQQAAEHARWERERKELRAQKELEEARVKALERQLDLISTARNLNEHQLTAVMRSHCRPRNIEETLWVDRIITCIWRARRLAPEESGMTEDANGETFCKTRERYLPREIGKLDLLMTYEERLMRQVQLEIRELEKLRGSESLPAPSSIPSISVILGEPGPE